jgi:UDP-galactopyranose mutase
MNIVCLSHLRWQFVFQRPQHLLSRAARDGEVLYVEEPTYGPGLAHMDVTRSDTRVLVGNPHLPYGLSGAERTGLLRTLIANAVRTHIVGDYVLWFYTPMALPFAHDLNPIAVVYDCMDELSAFAEAPPSIAKYETDLFRRADVVFAGGQSLFDAKRGRHRHVHLFPSGVDVSHFARARQLRVDPDDQADIPHPRLGYFGVIDERMDYALVSDVARMRPDRHIVLIGPTAKVDTGQLPRAENIHYLGGKPYAALPDYIAGWDVALLPFARNDATQFISPTKTPEYLAAGKPVVSTSIRDVVDPYGIQGLARIADAAPDFVAAVEASLEHDPTNHARMADAFLAHMSWDATWAGMQAFVEQAITCRAGRLPDGMIHDWIQTTRRRA